MRHSIMESYHSSRTERNSNEVKQGFLNYAAPTESFKYYITGRKCAATLDRESISLLRSNMSSRLLADNLDLSKLTLGRDSIESNLSRLKSNKSRNMPNSISTIPSTRRSTSTDSDSKCSRLLKSGMNPKPDNTNYRKNISKHDRGLQTDSLKSEYDYRNPKNVADLRKIVETILEDKLEKCKADLSNAIITAITHNVQQRKAKTLVRKTLKQSMH